MKTYSKVYISIHYYKFYSAEFDSKYRSIKKPLLSNKKQTNSYLFYYLESPESWKGQSRFMLFYTEINYCTDLLHSCIFSTSECTELF